MINNIDNLKSIISPTSGYPSRGIERSRTGETHGTLPADSVRISQEGRDKLKASANQSSPNSTAEELSPEEKQVVAKLKKRDQEVKAHENAHMSAGAGVVQGGATYQYQRGPDGRMFAVGGEVKIDTSRENSPEATIRKMQQVKKAALAPSQPSGQDRSVAAQASQIETEARAELTQKNTEETNKDQENQFTAATPRSAGINTPQNSSNTGRHIDITV